MAPIIAFTDEDVSTDWLQQISSLFEREPEAALVFGKVPLPDELKGKGFAADFEPDLVPGGQRTDGEVGFLTGAQG
jgi:hypothetical protein